MDSKRCLGNFGLLVFGLLVALPSAKLFADKGGDRKGFEIGAGPAVIEEGDDRFRPGAMAHIGFGHNVFGRFYGYGRKFGPVTERTWMVSLQKGFPMFGVSWIHLTLGATIMDEYTELKYSDGEGNTSSHSYNLGFIGGVHFPIPAVSPIYFELGWDSHLFLAGPNGGLFLATGRKQAFSVGLGVRL